MGYKPKATKHRRQLNAARIARYRARLRHGQSVFKVEGNKADIILALRGLAHTAGMHEFMLTPEASREEIEEKLSMLVGHHRSLAGLFRCQSERLEPFAHAHADCLRIAFEPKNNADGPGARYHDR